MSRLRDLFALFLCLAMVLLSFQVSFGAFSKNTSVEEFSKKNKPFLGDFDGMVKRRYIRLLIPYSKTFFFFDGAQPKGLGYEGAVGFNKYLNKKLKSRHVEVKVLIIPTPREQLFTSLELGLGDIATGNLTITEERQELVDFSDPFMTGVSEVLVTPKNTPQMKSVLELAGKEVHTRKSSSYYTSLEKLNNVFSSTGKKGVDIQIVDEHLEDEDLMEMVSAELIPAIVVDRHKAEFWAKILPNIRVHSEVEVASGGRIAWAVRKNCPKLKKVVNEYVEKNKKGTLTGNVVFNRYLKDTKYIKNATQGENIKRFNSVIDIFTKYGDIYDFDYLMLTALAYQESKLDQKLRSKVGAVGVMQILPSTAKDKNVGIPDIQKIEPNIHAGTKYLRYVADRYFPESSGIDKLNRALFSFASYNAGPAKITRLREEAEQSGLNPNLWFNNVELIAAKRIGRETVQYVSNIFKYYIAYKLQQEKLLKKK
jgi:membrane-bound lytic murein transglycosylase MltF